MPTKPDLTGIRVRAYRNLRHGRKSRPLYSLTYKGRVIARRHRLLLTDCKFIVQKAGYERVIATGHKNVHAYVEGTIAASAFGIDKDGKDLPAKVSYNPHKGPNFIYGNDSIAYDARAVLLNENGISAAYVNNIE